MYHRANTGWPRVIGCLIFKGHFLQKNPTISCSFAKNDLHLKAFCRSSPPCNTHFPLARARGKKASYRSSPPCCASYRSLPPGNIHFPLALVLLRESQKKAQRDLIGRNPPPGGYAIYKVPSSRTVNKRTPLEEPGTHSSRVQSLYKKPLIHGS